MNRAHRLLVLAGMFLAAMAALPFVEPIPQDPAYPLFADTRPCPGIPNCGDVVSNAGFSLAGLLGLWGVPGPRGRRRFAVTADMIDRSKKVAQCPQTDVGMQLTDLGSGP
ncbi:MAG: hypothetical protein MI741_09865 [Rhodospirillales bacterium]|nr:hypothetical protein [Rhodospirillales bacterium]